MTNKSPELSGLSLLAQTANNSEDIPEFDINNDPKINSEYTNPTEPANDVMFSRTISDRSRAQNIMEDLFVLSRVANGQRISTRKGRIQIDSLNQYSLVWLQGIYRFFYGEDRTNGIISVESHLNEIFQISRNEVIFREHLLKCNTLERNIRMQLQTNERFLKRIQQCVLEAKNGLQILESSTYLDDPTIQAKIMRLKNYIDDELAALRENLSLLGEKKTC